MPEPNWIETKKEYTVDENGVETLSKVTREFDKPEPQKSWWAKHKDTIDSAIKLIG